MTHDEIKAILDKLTDIESGSLDRLAYKAGYFKGWLAYFIQEDEAAQQELLERFLKATTEGNGNG